MHSMHEGVKEFDLSVFGTIAQNRDKSNNIINKLSEYNKITKMQKG